MSRTQEFWNAQAAWSNATFGDEQTRGPMGPLLHLQKEVQEAIEAKPGSIHQAREITDCLFLVFDAARRSGMTLDSLLDEAFKKLEVNKQRAWPTPTSDAPVEHVRHS